MKYFQALVTFSISDPYRFIYRISASDFDQVFQAACQNTLRAMVRQISSDKVNSLTRQDTQAHTDSTATVRRSPCKNQLKNNGGESR